MTDDERREQDMFKRALAALTAEFSDLPEQPEIRSAIQIFRAAVARIDAESASQNTHQDTAQEGTVERKVARRAIREFMERYAKTAYTIARRRPGFDENFPMPYGKNDEQLLAAARSVDEKALLEREAFLGLGIKPAYLEASAAKIEAFAAALDKSNAATVSRGAAVSGRKNAFDEAEDNFLVIDTYIKNAYADDPAKLDAWRIATRIERAPRPKKGGNTTPPA
ncbi:MAG: hypothetical protein LUM44_20095 [Pyrinomonadaceae bacterium]|nr:hypothetical protein [Pyrinomonadaceae bacterium]